MAYAILWLVMPKATTTTQKLEMQGEVVTIQKISEFVEENIDKIKKKDSTKGKTTSRPVMRKRPVIDFNKSLLHSIGSLIKIILGVVFVVVGTIGIIALTIGSFALLIALPTAPADPVVQIIVDTVFGENTHPTLVVALYFIVFIPLLKLLLGGIGILRKKPVLTTPIVVILAVVWFYSLISTLLFGASNVHTLQERIQALEEPTEIPLEVELDELDTLFDKVLEEASSTSEIL